MNPYFQRFVKLLRKLKKPGAASIADPRRLPIDVEHELPPAKLDNELAEALAIPDFSLRAKTDDNVFFVVGPARSGASATIRALSQAENATCFEQKMPRFTKYVRNYELGLFDDVEALVLEHRWPDMHEALAQGKIYGEKDQQIYPWVSRYWRLFGGRYVNVVKDGRDAVRSLMDFHYNINGFLYLDAPDTDKLSPDVREAQQALLLNNLANEAETSRPRPCIGDPLFETWKDIPRIGMVARYWSHVIRFGAMELRKVPTSRQIRIDFTGGPSIERFEELYRFLGLEGFDREHLSEFLDSRPNSIESKLNVAKKPFPSWPDWTEDQQNCFDLYASAAMVENGFYPIEKFPYRLASLDFESTILQLPPLQLSEGIVGSIVRSVRDADTQVSGASSTILLLPDELQANIAAREVESCYGSFTLWSGGAIGSIPTEPREAVITLGMLETSPDIVRLLKKLADMTQKTLVLGNLFAPYSYNIDNSYRSSSTGSGMLNEVSLSSTMSLLEHSLGFRQVTLRHVETGWNLNPRAQLIVAVR